MDKVLLAYNPVSGSGKIPAMLDGIIGHYQKQGVSVLPLRTPFSEDTFHTLLVEGCSSVLAAGGDGTIHRVVNCMLRLPDPPPLRLIPCGTANDFAENLGLSTAHTALGPLAFHRTRAVDVGLAGDRYFVNVASGGLLTDIAYKVDQRLKHNLGLLAYYLRGVAELPNLRPVEVQLEAEGKRVFSGEIFLFLVLNGRAAGKLGHLAPRAKPDDGLLDILLFKKCAVIDFLNLFLKVVSGKHLDDHNVLYLQSGNASVTCNSVINTDLDGEEGPPLPWQVQVLPRRLKVFVP